MFRTLPPWMMLVAATQATHAATGMTLPASRTAPVALIFDTDMGNDIDDALALAVIHALASRGECVLLAATSSKDNPFSAAFIDLINTFYGRADIPVGAVRGGPTPEEGYYTGAICRMRDGDRPRYPHALRSGDEAPEAVALLRRTLAAQPDGSVVFLVTGFSTNAARLLDSPPDAVSPLPGIELVRRKCRQLSIMAGHFAPGEQFHEYNIIMDVPSAQRVFARWPTPVVVSGFEIGQRISFPAESIEADFRHTPCHPVTEAYRCYAKMPYDRPTWDLTSVLYAVRPDRGYFDLSEPGTVSIDDRGHSIFRPDPSGRHRFLKVKEAQVIRVREALVQLVSQPPVPRHPDPRRGPPVEPPRRRKRKLTPGVGE